MIKLDGYELNFEVFPNGETRVDSKTINHIIKTCEYKVTIHFKYENDSDLIKLMFVRKHIGNNIKVDLKITYMPYSRMDRVENNSVFTLKYVSEFINSLDFNNIEICQPHSDVTCALVNNSVPYNMSLNILNKIIEDNKVTFYPTEDYIYYPDASAEKHFGKELKYKSLTGLKLRDFETGKIKKLDIAGELPTKPFNVIMIDDLCSYGGTFILGAEKLKQLGADKIYLVVAHCEDSIYKGKILENDLITKVFTTNSILTKNESNKIEIINLI